MNLAAEPKTADILTVHAPPMAAREVIRISATGELFWKGREITTDDDFRAAMLALSRYLRGDYTGDYT